MRPADAPHGNRPPELHDLQIEPRPIASLKLRRNNPRTHSEKQIRQIAASIETFGFTNPVLIDATGTVIAGHGRVRAAKLLGMDTVPTVQLEHLSEAQVRAYVIADNQLAACAGWDRDLLAIELQELAEIELDFDLEVMGFETAELDLLIGGGAGDAETDPADAWGGLDPDAPTVSRPGDLWRIGPHRLLCADAFDRASYDRLLGGQKAQLVFVDPPYNVRIEGHDGNSATATGGFAPRVPAHESQWIPVPEEVSDDAAALADPFSVSLHAILRVPPTPGDTALVYGAGTLGLLAVAILRALHPDVRVLVVARFDHQALLAAKFGAERVLRHRPTRRILEEVAEVTGAELAEPWRGLPMLNGGADVVYDTVSSAETFEVGLRAVRTRARIVALGVEPPRRFEWTPLYFKEISIVGSNGFGIEEYERRRQHAMQWYFEFIRTKRIDVTPIITHRFPLEAYREAFMTCYAQGEHGAIKVLFDRFPE